VSKFLEESQRAVDEGRCFLEERSVTAVTRDHYDRELLQFKKWMIATGSGDDSVFGAAPTLDGVLLQYFTTLFFAGEMASRGTYVLAAVMFRHSQYAKNGPGQLPRAWRALKGWRSMCPPRSRLPLVRQFWFGVAMLLATRGEQQMAVFVLISLSSYLRPNQLLMMKKRHLVRPLAGVSGVWTCLANAYEGNRPSKAGEFDVSILLDSEWFRWGGALFERLVVGSPDDPLFGFSYPSFLSCFQAAVATLKQPKVVPYQLRHSGPSCARAAGARSQAEIKKRGQWKADRSVARYEKAGRLTSQGHLIPPEIWAYLRIAELQLPEVLVCGREGPPAPR